MNPGRACSSLRLVPGAVLQTLAAVSNRHLICKELVPMVSTVLSPDVTARYWNSAPLVSRDGERAVLWLEGEQDIATAAVLANTLADVISADDANLIVDLSGVTFMSTATIDELMRARSLLSGLSRNVTLRSPSRCARRLLDVCGLAGLVEPSEPRTGH